MWLQEQTSPQIRDVGDVNIHVSLMNLAVELTTSSLMALSSDAYISHILRGLQNVMNPCDIPTQSRPEKAWNVGKAFDCCFPRLSHIYLICSVCKAMLM